MPMPLVIDDRTFVSVMFQVTSLVTVWLPLPLNVAAAVNVIETEVMCGKVSGLAVIVRLVTAGQTETDAVAGVSAWYAAVMVVVCGGLATVKAAVTKPVFCPTVAAAGLLEVQKDWSVTTLLGDPSLGTPEAIICRVPPGGMVSPVGPTVMLVIVGVTKKPRQLTARAKVASAAKAPARRSLYFVDDIVIWDSLGARC